MTGDAMTDLALIGPGLDAIIQRDVEGMPPAISNAARAARYRRAHDACPSALIGLRHSYGRQMRAAWCRGEFPDMRGWRDVMARIDSAAAHLKFPKEMHP